MFEAMCKLCMKLGSVNIKRKQKTVDKAGCSTSKKDESVSSTGEVMALEFWDTYLDYLAQVQRN